MTSPDSGSTRPLRVAGLALLGVAAVALVIGLVTMFGGNGDGRADGGNGTGERPPESTTSSSSRPGGNPPSSAITSKSVPPTTTTTTGSSPTTGTTTTTTPARPPGDGNGEPEKSVPVRVLNNSTVSGLAATAADDLREDGWQVTEIGNYSASNLPETTVFFRPGTTEEAAARALATTFGLAVKPRIDTLANQPAGIIIVVTSDYTETDKNER
ncbi:LytR C-terminal domain-containing protein [Actinophytocola glycyrrhizae]|uniref:LytR C-terminal domain-containing protein n=1 Tax=Actinophytocola glycyrrhizae TaxID=2044873 RepID=A0ABV9S1A2_9PSEU